MSEARALAAVVRDYVARKTAKLSAAIETLRSEVSAIPSGPQGLQGEPGREGPAGKDGRDGVDGSPGIRGEKGDPGERGADGVAGMQGERGQDGPQGPQGERGEKGDPGEPGLPGRDGKDGVEGPQGPVGGMGPSGKNADAELVRTVVDAILPEMFETARASLAASVADAVASMPVPKDGRDGRDAEPVHPDTVRAMVLEEVQRVVAAQPRPRDGEPGRDAIAVDPLPGIDPSKSYPRGTYAEHRGGTIRALRNTDSVTDSLERAGWSVCMNGVFEETEETLDQGRTVKRTTVYTNGRAWTREIKSSVLLYRGVWREGLFENGDVVTWSGSAWHCQEPTTDKPGTSSAWKLMVKEGARGKDGKVDVPAARGPVHIVK